MGHKIRKRLAAALVRALGLRAEKEKAPFSDIETSDWYNGEIATAAAYGLIGGFADGSFRPNETVTREPSRANFRQLFLIFARLFNCVVLNMTFGKAYFPKFHESRIRSQ